MGAVHAGIGDLGDRGAAGRERHALEWTEVLGGGRTRAPRPPSGPRLDGGDATGIVTQRDLEMMEVVLQPALDHTVVCRDQADPPPERAVGIADADGRRASVAHALRFLPPG